MFNLRRERFIAPSGRRYAVPVALALTVAALVVPAFASAATVSVYAPGPDATNFGTSDGGWASHEHYSGLCVPGLTCGAVDNAFVAGGGLGGPADGFLQANYSGLASVGIAATSTSVWRSPSFTYDGAEGNAANEVVFRISRRAELDDFLALPDTGVSYRVTLLNHSGGQNRTLISTRPAQAPSGFATAKDGVFPSHIDQGSEYSIKVKTKFRAPVGIVPAGHVDYDNIALKAFDR